MSGDICIMVLQITLEVTVLKGRDSNYYVHHVCWKWRILYAKAKYI